LSKETSTALHLVSHWWAPPAPHLKLAGWSTAALHSLPPPRFYE
jgi:hypothetical protein